MCLINEKWKKKSSKNWVVTAPLEDPVKYRQIVGDLQYVTLSRPEITFAVNNVCQFMHPPTINHWFVGKQILHYLCDTSDHGLFLSHSSPSMLHAYTNAEFNSMSAFSDADWAGCPDDYRSTGGFAIYLSHNLISCSSRKQKIVSRSSTKSEYKALADTVAKVTWIETLLRELHVTIKYDLILWCDNVGVTYLSANPVFHAWTKHANVDFHFFREKATKENSPFNTFLHKIKWSMCSQHRCLPIGFSLGSPS